ncbi:MAG TPA: PQQ-binding-like beta-propeller repeat protein [Candidatus Limnocylindrales bacterium]|nr:PQQ-binding-like beta-propeller repeat protein [Candidatus Limnocylindrales bacterium]
MFRGNLAHTGVYSAPGVPKLNAIKWKFQTAGRVISSPAIVDGVAYVGSTDGNLYALDAVSGTLKWKFATQSWVVSSPAVVSGVVFFESYDSNFYAVDGATGKEKWRFKTGGEKRFAGTHLHHLEPAAEAMPDPWDFFLSSPSVWKGLVYFGSGDGNIYALDTASGLMKWKFHTGDVVHSSPAIADGTLYIGSWDSFLYALDAATGQERWRFKTGEDPELHNHVGIQSSPVVADNTVYFGCRDSYVYAVDATTGKQKWTYSTQGSWVNNSPVVYDGKIYFGTSIPGNLHALDAKTGASLFQLPTGTPVFSSMALASGILYMGNFGGKLTAIDLKTQRPIWTFETEGAKMHASALTNNDGSIKFEAVFPSPSLFYDDMVVAVSKLFTMGTILSSPVVVNNVVYFGSTDGNLYALM